MIHLETTTTTTTTTLSKPKKTMVNVTNTNTITTRRMRMDQDVYIIIYNYDTDTVGHREYSSLSSGLTWSYSHTLQNHGICGGSTSWYIYTQFPTIHVTVCSAFPNIIYYHKLSYLLFFRLSCFSHIRHGYPSNI